MTLMTPSRRWLLITSSVFFMVLVALLASAGRDGKPQQAATAEPAPVDVMPVRMHNHYTKDITLVGRVESSNNALLGFELAGQVASLTIEEGHNVIAGQVLAKLDTARLQAQYQELNAAVDRAKAEEALANVSLTRLRDLLAKRLESAQRVDEAKASLEAASASVVQAQAALARIQVELQKSQLIAPFDGVVVARHVDVGSFVNAGTAVLEVQEANSLRIRVAVPPTQADQLQQGNSYRFQRNHHPFNATLSSITARRQLSTQTLDALFLPAPQTSLVSGELVSLVLSDEMAVRGSWLPLSALDSGVRGTWTLLVTRGEGLQQLEARAVSLVYTDGRNAYVSGALDENDYVVVAGTQRLVNKQAVQARLSTSAGMKE